MQKYPDFTPAKINLARVDVMLGDRPAADKILADVLAKQPTAEPALTMVVSGYVQANQLPDAIALLERAHRADPNQTRITVSLGDLYIRAGTPQKALDLAAAEKGANASSTDILSLRAAAYLALGQKKDARATYTEILKQRRQRDRRAAPAGRAADRGRRFRKRPQRRHRRHRGQRRANYQLYQDYVDDRPEVHRHGCRPGDRRPAAVAGPRFRRHQGAEGRHLPGGQPPGRRGHRLCRSATTPHPSSLLVTRLAGALLRAGRADEATSCCTDWLGKHADDMVATEQLAEINIATGKLRRCREVSGTAAEAEAA